MQSPGIVPSFDNNIQQMGGNVPGFRAPAAVPGQNFAPQMTPVMGMKNIQFPAGYTGQPFYGQPGSHHGMMNHYQSSAMSNYANAINAMNPDFSNSFSQFGRHGVQMAPNDPRLQNNYHGQMPPPQQPLAGYPPMQTPIQYTQPQGGVPGRLGVNTPGIALGPNPYNQSISLTPYSQGHQRPPQRNVDAGAQSARRPNQGQPSYTQQWLSQRSTDPTVAQDASQPGKQPQSHQVDNQDGAGIGIARQRDVNSAVPSEPTPNATASASASASAAASATGPGAGPTNDEKGQHLPGNDCAKHPSMAAESGTMPAPGEQNKSLSGAAQATRISAIIKEGVEKAFAKGLREGHGRVFAAFRKDLVENKTLFGLAINLPEGKTPDEVVSHVYKRLGSSFDHCSAEVPNHQGVRTTRQWFERSIMKLGEQSVASYFPAAKAGMAPRSEHSSGVEKAPHHNNDKTSNKETGFKTVQGAGKGQAGKRAVKRRSADYTILGVQAQYEYEGKSSVSYKCSDGQTRILSPRMVQELKQRGQVSGTAGSGAAGSGAAGLEAASQVNVSNVPPKRKSTSRSRVNSVAKKVKVSHEDNQATASHPFLVPDAVQTQALLAGEAENQAATGITLSGTKRNDTRNVDATTSGSVDAHPAVSSAKVESDTVQPAQETQTAVTCLDGDCLATIDVNDLFDWAQFEQTFGCDPTQLETLTAEEPVAIVKSIENEAPAAKGPVTDPEEERIKELITVDKGLPFGLIKAFINPRAGSIYGAVRDAVQRNDLSDQSHLLLDSEHRKMAKAEYDTHSREKLGLTTTDVPEWDPTVRNAEKRQHKMQKRREEEQAAADRLRDTQTRLEAEQQDQKLKDAPTVSLDGPQLEPFGLPDGLDLGANDASMFGLFGDGKDMMACEDDFEFLGSQHLGGVPMADMGWGNEQLFDS